MKVSVIVPVYNPGAHFDKLVDSLLEQSLAAGEFEVIFVDSGSTDGTTARLDALAAEHPHVRVRAIPNSGGPARPRNAGLELAAGEFVFFADHDDWLGREALERLHATAVADGADVVFGKVVGHGGRLVPGSVFAENRHGITVDAVPFDLLAPHKLFRRALLDEHGLRFPEPERPLEDHQLVVPALFKASGISIVADYPCYHWAQREDRQNLSLSRRDFAAYYASVAAVLDLVDAHTEPGEFRDRLYVRWYRGKLLSRVGNRATLRRDPQQQAQIIEVGRALTAERFPLRLDARLAYADGLRAALLRRGADDALKALAGYDGSLRAGITVRRVQGDGTWLTLRLTGRLRRTEGRERPTFVRNGERLRFDAPEPLRSLLQAAEAEVTDALATHRATVQLRSLEDDVSWDLPLATRVRLVEGEDGRLEPRLDIRARLAPTIAAGGSPLPPGEYAVRVTVGIAGFRAATALKHKGQPFTITVSDAYRLEHPGLRPPPAPPAPWRRFARRVPGAIGAVKGARRLRRALSKRLRTRPGSGGRAPR